MTEQAKRLWEKGTPLDETVHRFTVGDDPVWDMNLVHWDCLASSAHARTLEKAGVLTHAECDSLIAGLAKADALHRDGKFVIPPDLEDCHTALEAFLLKQCGQAGQKIHTGRSRNDQVVTAMRLWMRHQAAGWLESLTVFVDAALARIDRDGDVPMPGYTHLQPAMPSSIGQWLHAFVEAALEQTRATFDLLDRLDACPLGTGAGFGVPLAIDREYTAGLLGFGRVQRSPIDVQNSRGRMEAYFVRVAVDVAAIFEKLSWDMILFSTAEFGFFVLPESMTTGSSIMPQKKNPDVLELLRARSARMRARLAELEWVSGKLPSSYHRDLQLTKEPAMRSAAELVDILRIGTHLVANFAIARDRLEAAMKPELFATEAALDLVQKGMPFREAYRKVADDIHAGTFAQSQPRSTTQASGMVPAGLVDVLTDERTQVAKRTSQLLERFTTAEALLKRGTDT